jgi:hypothetical protein
LYNVIYVFTYRWVETRSLLFTGIVLLVTATLAGCGMPSASPTATGIGSPGEATVSPTPDASPTPGEHTAAAPDATHPPTASAAWTNTPKAPAPQNTPLVSATQARGALLAPYADLLAKAEEEGYVNVIVGLDLPTGPFKPEGTLTASEIEAQRQAIAATRQALLGSLEGYDVEAYAWWDSVPHVALRVDREALEQLIESPYVTALQEDTPDEPHGEGSGVEP